MADNERPEAKPEEKGIAGEGRGGDLLIAPPSDAISDWGERVRADAMRVTGLLPGVRQVGSGHESS